MTLRHPALLSVLSKLVAVPVALGLVLATSQAAAARPADDHTGRAPAPAAVDGLVATEAMAESDTGLYLVQLTEPALASYAGGITGLAPTSPRVSGADSLDVDAPASVAYREHLAASHAAFAGAMEATLDRGVEVAYEYLNAFNGMAVAVDPAEAARLATLPGVAAVHPDRARKPTTDVSHDLIGTASFWDGETGPGVDTRGEGMVVAMFDTGVNAAHPSFASVDGEGYAHDNPLGEGTYLGVCDPGHPAHEDVCNDKLIGAYNLHPAPEHGTSVLDWDSHGSHTGSTMAGNVHEATVPVGVDTFTRTVQGVAPRANVVSYLVCSELCPATAAVAAVNQAIQDEIIDVINYSIGGTDDPWNDPVDLAFLDAYEAGIFVSASAGNGGPGPSTVAKTGPWNAAVAASAHQRVFAHTLDVRGPAPVPVELAGLPAFPASDGPQLASDLEGDIRVVEDNPLGCDPFPAGAFDGAIALIQRGDCTFALKEQNAAAAGATAVVITNNVAGPPSAPGGLTDADLVVVMVEQEPGAALREWVADHPDSAQVRVNLEAEMFLDPDSWEDVLAGFSSRGPSQFDMLAPTYAAPGVNILAAAREGLDYTIIGGTSMAAPHGAGAAALLMSLHPEWSPAQVRSALAGTADAGVVVKEDGVTPADPFDQGSGRLDLAAAARVGLVLDETLENFAAADPDAGGDPKTLNTPSLVNQNCVVGHCSWSRTVTSVADTAADYTVAVDAPPGLAVEVSPESFTIEPGGTQTVQVEVTAHDLAAGDWAFADLLLSTTGSHAGGEPIAPVHYPVVLGLQPPTLLTDPEEITATQPPDEVTTQALTVHNVGGEPLTWQRAEGEPSTTLWNQPATGTNGIVSDFYNGLGTGVYAADDFYAPAQVAVEEVHTDGSFNVGGLDTATEISWFIYPDDGGGPAGHPQDGRDAHVFAHTAAPDGAGVTIADDNVTLDLAAATGGTLSLDPGRYWLSVFPSIDGPCCPLDTRWNWSEAAEQRSQAQLVDPGNLFGAGATDWTPLPALGVPFAGTAFRLAGTVDCDPPFLGLSPDGGTVDPLGSAEAAVTLDSTGLVPGEYPAALCLDTNDPAAGVAVVPVSLAVEQPAEIPVVEVAPEALSAEVAAGQTTNQTLTIGNAGEGVLDWSVDTAEPEGGLAAVPELLADAVAAIAAATSDHALAGAGEVALGNPAAAAPGAAAAPAAPLPLQQDAVTITHSASDQMVEGSIACVDRDIGGTVDNGYLRAFTLSEFGIDEAFEVSEVSFGIELLSLAAPVQVHLYTMVDPGGEVVYSNLQQLGTTEVTLDPQEFTVVDVPVAGTAGPGDTLVVEVEPADLRGIGNFFIGSNDLGQTGPSYLRSESCEVPEPADLALLGLPEMHIVMSVTGSEVAASACAAPVDVPWLTATPASGSTPAGGSSEVTVGIDASDLELGEHAGLLCVSSNDPATPRVEVPVSVTVVDGGQPGTCDRTILGMHPGPLTVTEGTTCLAAGAMVRGEVNVLPGAGLVATAAVVQGPVAATGATVVDLAFSQVTGPVTVSGATQTGSLFGNQVTGSVVVAGNSTGGQPIVVSGNTVIGSLSCLANEPPPIDHGLSNTVVGGVKVGQCADL